MLLRLDLLWSESINPRSLSEAKRRGRGDDSGEVDLEVFKLSLRGRYEIPDSAFPNTLRHPHLRSRRIYR